ncbi:hypothetical protein ACOME3_007203 [Neoechinorhynchus agilis]
MQMFMLGALDKLTKERDLRRSQNSHLRKVCLQSAEELRRSIVVTENGNKRLSINSTGVEGRLNDVSYTAAGARILPCPPESMAGIDVCKYLLPFELACQSDNAKLVEIGLDTIQKLVAYGHILDSQFFEEGEDKKIVRVIDRIVQIVSDCFRGDGTSDGVQLQIIKALLTVMTSQYVEVHDSTLLKCIRTCFNICLISRNPVNQTTAKATLTQIVNLVFMKMEQYSRASDSSLDDVSSDEDEVKDVVKQVIDAVARLIDYKDERLQSPSRSNHESSAIQEEIQSADSYSRDAYFVFNSLCRISLRPISSNDISGSLLGYEQPPDRLQLPSASIDVKSKILSLQLLVAIVQNPGPIFRQSSLLLFIVRNQLCVSLSANGVSSLPDVYELSLAIFVSLLAHFKHYLKLQIEVFFKQIIFTMIESNTSSLRHKWLSIQALKAICSNKQIILDLYVNYDCNLKCSNVFERLVTDLSRVAQPRSAHELGCTPGQEHSLRIWAFDCIVSLLKCLVECMEHNSSGDHDDRLIERSDNSSIDALSRNAESLSSGDRYDPVRTRWK